VCNKRREIWCTGIVVWEFKGRWRRENDVTPLWTGWVAKALRTVFAVDIWYPSFRIT